MNMQLLIRLFYFIKSFSLMQIYKNIKTKCLFKIVISQLKQILNNI